MARRDGGGLLTLSGVLFGAAIGAAVGLVYSPATGEENRRRIANWAKARLEGTRDRVSEGVDQAVSTARTGIESAANQARERVEAVKSEAESRIEQVRGEAQEVAPGAQTGEAAAAAREEAPSC